MIPEHVARELRAIRERFEEALRTGDHDPQYEAVGERLQMANTGREHRHDIDRNHEPKTRTDERRLAKGEEMPKMNTGFPQEPVLLEDRYPATLKECTEYEKDYGDGPVEKVAWVFAVQASADAIDPDIEFEGDAQADKPFEIAAHTSLATGPNSNFAKLNFPAWVGDGWSGDTDDLIGKEAVVDVTSYETKGGQVRNVIEKVRVPKKQAAGRKSKAEQEEEKDFSEILF